MDFILLIAGTLSVAAIVSTRFTQRYGVPALILFVGIGILAGMSGVSFNNYSFSLNAGLVALAIILLSGGLDTRGRLFRTALYPALMLSTVGVIVTMLVIGCAAYFITPLGFVESLLLGAVLAPTDAAAVFSVLKGRGLPTRLRGILEVESGTNDPVSIYLTLALTGVLVSGQLALPSLLLGLVTQLLLGALLGFLWGRALVWLVQSLRMDNFGLYPLLVLSGGLLAYATTNLLGGNGFLAIYLTGMILGNEPIPHRRNILYFMDGLAWGGQISMFLLLGLLVFPDRLLGVLPVALLLTLIMILLARPVATYLSLQPLQSLRGRSTPSLREHALLSWAGLKGAVPIILAIVPLMNRLPSGELIFNIVFVVVVVSTSLQGLTVGVLAKRLGLLRREAPQAPLRIDLGGLTPRGSAVFDVFLEEDTRAVGQRLSELTLPENLVIAAIYRHDMMVTPKGSTVFEAGDHVFLITSKVGTLGIPPVFRSKIRTRNLSADERAEAGYGDEEGSPQAEAS